MINKHDEKSFVFKLSNVFSQYKYLVQLLHGMLLTLAFHPFDIFIAIPVSFSGFLLYIERECMNQSKDKLFKSGFKHGFTFFFGHFITSLYWVVIPLFVDINRYWFLVPVGLVGLPAFLSVFYGVASGTICHFMFSNTTNDIIRTRRVFIAIAFACGFFISEIMRSHLFIQFPWNLLGYATGYSLSLMQFASVASVYGLSLLIYFIGTIPYTRSSIAISIMTIAVLVITIDGRRRLYTMDETLLHNHKVSLYVIQPNIDSRYYAKQERTEELKKIHSYLKLQNTYKTDANFILVILPESGIPYSISTGEEFIFEDIISQYSRNTVLVSGVDRYNSSSNENFNSIIVVNNSGEIVDSYDKLILAPFGEYIPGLDILSPIVNKQNGFTPGKRIRNFRLYNNVSDEALVIMPTICFESIFSPIADRRNLADVDFILNLTNDSWLGYSLGPYQHLAMARMRAIEYGVPVVRVAKTGVSAVFNDHGKLMRSIPINTEAMMMVEMPNYKSETTYIKILKFFRNK